jgi:hypothetical protein
LVKYLFCHVNVRVYGGRKIEIAPKRRLSSTKLYGICVTSGFRREKDENRSLADISVHPIGGQEYETGNNFIHGFKSLNNS